jgi:small neutral amino acid transporter SnatA (MarC family)
MFRASYIAIFVLLAVIVGGGVFLATWDIPAPSARVEKVLPDDRFPR